MASKDPQNTDPAVKTGDGSASKSKKKMTPEEQSAQFIKTARELGGSEVVSEFEQIVSKVLGFKPTT